MWNIFELYFQSLCHRIKGRFLIIKVFTEHYLFVILFRPSLEDGYFFSGIIRALFVHRNKLKARLKKKHKYLNFLHYNDVPVVLPLLFCAILNGR